MPKLSETVHLLIVDDDEIDREHMRRSLQKADVRSPIVMAENGRQALDAIRGVNGADPLPRPFIVLLDWNMPRMNGDEFLAELRRDEALRTSSVFVLTTSNAVADIERAQDHLVAGYIVKDKIGSASADLINLLDAFALVVELPE